MLVTSEKDKVVLSILKYLLEHLSKEIEFLTF